MSLCAKGTQNRYSARAEGSVNTHSRSVQPRSSTKRTFPTLCCCRKSLGRLLFLARVKISLASKTHGTKKHCRKKFRRANACEQMFSAVIAHIRLGSVLFHRARLSAPVKFSRVRVFLAPVFVCAQSSSAFVLALASQCTDS